MFQNLIRYVNNYIKISDHGLLSLKKLLNLTKGYTNKSIYTAPELLNEKSNKIYLISFSYY